MNLEGLLAELKASQSENDPLYRTLSEIATLDKERGANLARIKTYISKLERLVEDPTKKSPAQIKTWLEEYKRDLTGSEEQTRRRFGVDLEAALKPLDITLSGVYPKLAAGLFTLKVDRERDRVALWYGPEQERLAECRMRADEVKSRIEQALRTLGSHLDLEPFVGKLRNAYRRTQGSDNGNPVPIIAVLPELAIQLQSAQWMVDPLKENYRGYGRADFSYDLFRLGRAAIPHGLRLTVAVRSMTARRPDFLWIPDDDRGRGTPYSHLHFEEN